MDVESDDEDSAKRPDDKAKAASMPPPLPPQLDNVLIRKDYNPKSSKISAPAMPAQPKESWVISPITGEKVPADKLHEHMRYALLDPRWVEERERSIQDKMNQEEVYAPGTSIENSLKNLAERRTDIFGSGDVETAIGQKIGEEEHRKPDKPTWDGFNSSAESVSRQARTGFTIEEQIQQIHKTKGLLPDLQKDRIGPASTHIQHQQHQAPQFHRPQQHQQHNMHMHQQHQQQHQHSMPNMSQINSAPPVQMQPNAVLANTVAMMGGPHGSAFLMPNPMLQPGMFGGPMMHPDMGAALHQMNVPGGFGGFQGGPPPLHPEPSDEPAAKKQKTEENLIPEEEFIASNPSPVTFQIIVPQVGDKPEWKLNGQTFTLTLPPTDSISTIKAKIHEQLGLPPGKQKLQYEGMFVKDSNTVGFYNMTNGVSVILALKERGGRKK